MFYLRPTSLSALFSLSLARLVYPPPPPPPSSLAKMEIATKEPNNPIAQVKARARTLCIYFYTLSILPFTCLFSFGVCACSMLQPEEKHRFSAFEWQRTAVVALGDAKGV